MKEYLLVIVLEKENYITQIISTNFDSLQDLINALNEYTIEYKNSKILKIDVMDLSI